MAKKQAFPKQIFVKIESDGNASWLDANREADGFENDAKIAVYQLVEVKTKKVTHALE